MSEIRIIHTSDFHGALTPDKAARLRELKRKHAALLIDSGDAVRAPNVALLPWRENAIRRMNEAGYDAMGLGNREYFFRAGGMQWKTGHAGFLRICSNLRTRRGDLPGMERWGILDAPQGGRVGLLALMPTMIERGHWFEWLSNTRFEDWPEAARTAASALAPKCELIVALFHRREEEIGELATLCPAVDVVLAGHTHSESAHLYRACGHAPVGPAGNGEDSDGVGPGDPTYERQVFEAGRRCAAKGPKEAEPERRATSQTRTSASQKRPTPGAGEGPYVSQVADGGRAARLIGLRIPGKSITIDELVELD